MEKLWLKNYPPGIPKDLPPLDKSLIQLFEEACTEFKDQTAFISFDKKISYHELKENSLHFAGYLQSQGFKKGDSLVIQLPNLLQYPISLWAAILSGLTVLNMNPLYTAREMIGPIKETKAKGIILLSSNLTALKSFIDQTDIKSVIVTDPGDLLDFPKKQIINLVFKYKNKTQKKILNSLSFLKALHLGSKKKAQIPNRDFKETFFIQYTGGTTGVSKGVCLSQKNILSNLKQCEVWMLKDPPKRKRASLGRSSILSCFCFDSEWSGFLFKWFQQSSYCKPQTDSLAH